MEGQLMIRFLIRAAIFVGTAAIGLLIASWLVSGVTLRPSGFIIAVGVFALAQSLLAPFIFNVARQHAAPLLGGIGLVSTLVALIIASFFPEGLSISGASSWVLATLVVWIVSALGTWLLPLYLLKEKAGNAG